MEQPTPVIDLSLPRRIVIDDRGKPYIFTVSPIGRQQWNRYFEGIQSTSENQNGKRVDFFESTSARLALVEEVLLSAEGYKIAGDQPIESIAGWQTKIPIPHKLAVGNVLVAVGISQSQSEDAITLGRETVYLEAVWGANDQGKMTKYRGLAHHFSTPTGEQQRRYSRDSSRSRIVGSGRNAKTLWLGVQPTLVQLYDELIEEVEGYAFEGQPLAQSEIAARMDSYHKVAAAQQLFEPADVKMEEGRD